MEPNNPIDFQGEMGYNVGNYDEHADVIKMDEQKPINDVECTHPTLVPDPSDTLGDAVYHGCANPKCGLGWYLHSK